VITQTLIIHIIRTAKMPFIESSASSALLATTLLVAATGVVLPFTPIGRVLGFTPLPWAYWPALMLILLGYMTLTHLMKTWFIKRFGLS
jgi:Mg2+-importing ATPase